MTSADAPSASERARRLSRARRAALIWGLFVLAVNSWPSPPEVPALAAIPWLDKWTHALLYGAGGLLLYRAIDWPYPPRFSLARALVVTGAIAVFGTIDEIHQAWIPGRAAEASDALADTVGGFAGALLASARSRGRPTAPGDA